MTLLLHLSHRQVHDFLETYIREYLVWETWQEHVQQIPHAALLEHALEKRQSVAELLQEYRPLFHAEQITQEDRLMGINFLLPLEIPGIIEEFEAFTRGTLSGFLRLNIEWDFIQEVIDKEQILASAGLGWVNPVEVAKTLMRSLQRSELEFCSGVENISSERLPFTPVGGDENNSDAIEDERETASDENAEALDKGKQPEVQDGGANLNHFPCGVTPLFSLIPEPHGQHPIPAQQQMIRSAIQRMAPESYDIVQGVYVPELLSTLVEQERGPLPLRSVYRPRGHSFYVRRVAGIAGRDDEDLGYEILDECRDDRSIDSPLERCGARNAQTRDFYSIARREHRSELASVQPSWTGSFLGPARQPVSNPVTQRSQQRVQPSWEQQGDKSINAPDKPDHNVFGPSPEAFAQRGQYEQNASPVQPSFKLRQMLEKYRGFLEEANEEQKEDSDDGFDEDQVVMNLDDIPLPEPEKDDEYCPKKKSSRKPTKKKAAAVKTGGQGGRKRKAIVKANEKDNVTPKKNTGARRGQKKVQADTVTAENGDVQGDGTKKIVSIPKTPTKGQTETGPGSDPPSGRIKLIVRSSQKKSTAAELSNSATSAGMLNRNSPTPTSAPASRAKYASFAKHATDAVISTRAHFAHTAFRIDRGSEVAIPEISNDLIQPNELVVGFPKINIEGVRYADRAEFAVRAEQADYAGTAFEVNHTWKDLVERGADNVRMGID